MRIIPILNASIVCLAVGCTSVKSTLINRNENDVFIGNSNGKPQLGCAARPFNGIPITMRVPTHVDIVIKEKILMGLDDKQNLSRLPMQKRHLFVETEIVETEKVFTVDAKRPAAGTLKYDVTFGNDKNSQYFQQINSDIDDKTIQDVTAAIKSITTAIKTDSGESSQSEVKRSSESKITIIPEYRTVAWRRFDLDACDFEQQVSNFVAQHMNCCNTCQSLNAVGTNSYTVVPNEQVIQPGSVEYSSSEFAEVEQEVPSYHSN